MDGESPMRRREVGVAWLEAGLLDLLWDHDAPAEGYDVGGPIQDVSLLYRRLRAPRLTEQEFERLLATAR